MKTKFVILAGILAAGVPAAIAADAKTNWSDHCAKCHGAAGKGDTKLGKKLGLKDYSDAKVQAELKDEAIIDATLNGVKVDGKEKMKGYSDKLSADDAKAMLELIRSFKA